MARRERRGAAPRRGGAPPRGGALRSSPREVRAGDYDTAKSILTDAAHANGAARSPLVYQYIANVAAITGDLFVAVAAQKEALRLAPDLPLYRANLKRILTLPYEKAVEVRKH